MTDEQPDSSPGRPVPDEKTWKLLIETYLQVKGDIDKDDAALVDAIAENPSGFRVAYEVRQTAAKGRGLYVTEFVPKGACICDDRAGFFTTEKQWRDFLSLLPPDLARDCVDWVGVDTHQGIEAVFIDFCDMALMNHGSSKRLLPWDKLRARFSKRTKPRANVKSRWFNGMWHMVATRDIQAGEELLCDYSQSHNYDHGLEWFEEIYDEYYPDTPHHNELERWLK